MKKLGNSAVTAGCLALIAALNLALCWNLFYVEFTGHTNSLQGLWISMARLAGEHWYRPAWWPYQDAGVPFEHTYMPLVPASTALASKLAGVSAARAFYSVMGVALCLGPLTLFLMMWRLSGARQAAFWTALLYSVTSPARALLPETDVNPVRYWSSMRFYGATVWDDLPLQTAMCLLPLALLFLWRALESRRPVDDAFAVLFMALTALASVFGATALLLGAICILSALPAEGLRANAVRVVALGGAAYLVMCPFLPPSLIATIVENQQRFAEDRWSGGSLAALAIVVGGFVLLRILLDRLNAERWLRFFALFGFIAASVPLTDAYLHVHFLPQPNRYTAEMELGIALLCVPAIQWLWARLPRKVGVSLAAFFICLVGEHVPRLMRFAEETTRPVDLRRGFEAKVAAWIDEQMPGLRVMVPGSIAQWLNVFSDAPQLSGASYSTTPNWVQQEAMNSALTSLHPPETEMTVLWMKAFGVQAVTACGRNTPEFWKGRSSTKFDGLLPVLWRQEDTTIYKVPQRSTSLAHVIPEDAGARSTRAEELRRYVAALEDPAMPEAQLKWHGFRRISIETSAQPGQVVSVQTGWHRGWRAKANGRTVDVRRDGLGFLMLAPECRGDCRIELTYNGGWEYLVCRALSCLAIIGAAIYAGMHRGKPN